MRFAIRPSVICLVLLAACAWVLAPIARAEDPQTQPTTAPAARPNARASRVLIISVDGLRPDMMLRAHTPNMHYLFETGCYSFWARTTALAITLPSHTSMLTGVIPRRHEIEWNKDLPLLHPVYPKYPTLFQVARRAGYTTAMVAGKSKFEMLAVPDSLNWQWIAPTEKAEDAEVTEHAVQIILQHRPEVMFVHLPSTDNMGHKAGWGTSEQARTIEGADECIGRVLGALEDAKVLGDTIVIVTSDHGGAGKTHTPDDARCRHIPWIVKGPGIRKGVDLTTYPKLVIDTEDTFATACYLLGVQHAPDIDGKPIKEILSERGELLEPERPVADEPTKQSERHAHAAP